MASCMRFRVNLKTFIKSISIKPYRNYDFPKSYSLNKNHPTAQKVVSFYDEEINKYASKPISPVKFQDLLRFGHPPLSPEKLVTSAQHVLKELPPRLAKRVQAFQNLPYIVGINPHLAYVYGLYYESFEYLRSYPEIKTSEDNIKFVDDLLTVVKSFADVIPRLSQGFRECQRYMSEEAIQNFLDGMIRARIGIRLIAEQHIALHHNLGPEHVGILNTALQPGQLFKSTGKLVEQICEINYGVSPKLELSGHVDAKFKYCPVHLEYIAIELLKNAFRATAEFYQKENISKHGSPNYSSELDLPPVTVTIAKDQPQICLLISDRGGGIPLSHMPHIFQYSFTTVSSFDSTDGSDSSAGAGNIFDIQSKMAMQSGIGGPMAGLGYGLPMTRIYAQYFGGGLEVQSIEGYGTDVYLTLPNIHENMQDVVI
ncbi:hypothetical protein DSO57_1000148 [Entomophthora muscae]|uniref:Uncharacterized protein n=1 Tax=Entomophthora muscae TaxID=34485 RepID=A0ACC2T9C9_9FUNG|nr:hypothetical protein DSO57_1000148 [Entomophthora muscae]